MAIGQTVMVPWNDAVKMVAREVAQVVVKEHIATCPIRAEMKIAWWKFVATLLAAGALGGGSGAALAKALLSGGP
jgi:hypothetical protein